MSDDSKKMTVMTLESAARAGLALLVLPGLLLLLVWSLFPQVARANPDIFYVSIDGDDSGDCNAVADTCRTVQAAIAKSAPADEIFVAQGLYTDTAGTVALITESITLQGGWNDTFTKRNPELYPTTLHAQRGGPVIILQGPGGSPAITPTIEGLIITGGDGTGVADCTAYLAGGCGGGIFGTNALPQILNNVITDNIATVSGIGHGGGIYLQGDLIGGLVSGNSIVNNVAAISSTATVTGFGGGVNLQSVTTTLYNNLISGNLAATGEGYGGGISLYRNGSWIYTNTIRNNVACSTTVPTNLGSGGGIFVRQSRAPLASTPIIEDNELRENAAGLGGRGIGGGVCLLNTEAIITDNLIISNTAALNSTQQGDGGGILGNSGSAWTLSNNRVLSNTASTGGRGFGGGFFLGYAHVTVEGNLIAGNIASMATINVSARGGGVNLLACSGVMRHNTVRENAAAVNSIVASYGGGISVIDDPVALEGNTIVDNVATRWGGGVRVYGALPVTITNNLIAGNVALSQGDGVHVNGVDTNPASALIIHNTLAENTQGAAGEGVYVSGAASVTMTNNIVVSHSTGIENGGTPLATTITADYTLLAGNTVNTVGDVANTNALYSSPFFVNPSGDDYHIQVDSAAINAGANTWVSVDIDGDVRPQGATVDIGADEHIIVQDVELTPNGSDSGLPGDDLIYNHTLTNGGNYSDTFYLAYFSSLGWPVSIVPHGPVTLASGEARAITVTVSIPTNALDGAVDTTEVFAASQVTATLQFSDAAFDTVIDTTTVNTNYVAPTVAPDRAATARLSDTVVFTHALTNNSNTTESFALNAVSAHGWTTSVSPTPTVPAFGSATVAVTVTVPAGVIAGTSDVATFTATGIGGSDSAQDTTTVLQDAGIVLEPDRSASAQPDDSLTFMHVLTNTGNYTDTFKITVASAWIEPFAPTSVTLAPWGSQTVAVTFTVPSRVASSTVHTAVITATSQFHPGTFDTVQDRIMVTVYSVYLPLLERTVNTK
jgi:hypothetical protein